MKNYIKNNPFTSFIALLVVILLVGALVRSIRNEGVPSGTNNMNATSTVMASTSMPEVSLSQASLAYSVYVATSTFSQSQQDPIIVSVLNLTAASTTLSFKNGCQGDYTIGTFNMLSHTSCTASSTSVIVAPHAMRQVKLVHYPSVFKLPPGDYTLRASIIGYGGNSVPIKITQ